MIERKQQHGSLRQCVRGREKSLAQPQLELSVSTAGDDTVLYRIHHISGPHPDYPIAKRTARKLDDRAMNGAMDMPADKIEFVGSWPPVRRCAVKADCRSWQKR